METPPTGSAYFSFTNGHSVSSVDLNKKRKLQYESGGIEMPSPKQRFRLETDIFKHGSTHRATFPENLTIRQTPDDFDQFENSENDSNSFIGGNDSSTASDDKHANKNLIALAIHHNLSSTSLNSCSNEGHKSHLFSLDSRVLKEGGNEVSDDMEDTLQFDIGCKAMEEDIYNCYGLNNDESVIVCETDAETETMILYSNDLAPHSFTVSSGRWNLGQGTSLGAKKLTIDQEFEQYFSSLML